MKRAFKCVMTFIISFALAFTLIPFGPATALAAGSWTVTFDSQGGDENPDPVTVDDGDVIGYNNVSDPYRDGYYFNGWYTEPECVNNWDIESDTVVGNMTLYADWSPEEHNSDGLYYYDNWFYGGYIITGYKGTNPAVTIPHDINGKRVYGIYPGAFAGNPDITSVTFPQLTVDELASPSGKEISLNWVAFGGCPNLETVNLSSSGAILGEPLELFYDCPKLATISCTADNPFHESVDGVLFSEDMKTLCVYPPAKHATDETYEIPVSVENVRGTAFQSCQFIETINIPASVKSIDWMSFGYCPVLKSINVNASNTNYSSEDGVLFDKDKEELIAFPGGKAGAGDTTDTYEIPSTVEWIRHEAFEVAYELISISIPESVKDLGRDAEVSLFPAPKLEEIIVDPESPVAVVVNGVLFSKDQTTLLTYPAGLSASGVSSAGSDSIHTASNTAGNYTVPNNVNTIADYAFFATNLASVTIPDSVDKIGWDAFFGNSGVQIKANNLTEAYYYARVMDIPFYSLNGYYVVFDSAKGSEVPKQTVAQDSKAVVPANPTREGYDFVGWNTKKGDYAWDFNTPITDNLELYAVWKAWSPVGLTLQKADATTYNGTNGSITAAATGGSGKGYEYSISGGTSWQSSSSFGGLKAGSYTIIVRDSGSVLNKASATVAVGQPGLTGTYTGSKAPSKANAGSAIIINPPAPKKGYTMQSVSYTSSNPGVASVDQNGVVTFLTGGKATITITTMIQKVDKKGKVTTKKVVTKKTITVNQPVASVSLNQTAATIVRTQKVKLASAISPATASNKKVQWKSSNPKVASVSSSGVVTGKAGGTAVITCTAKDGSGASVSCTVTVIPIYPTGLKLSKPAITVKAGKTASLKATIAPKNTDFKTLVWSSSNTSVATVDAKGKIRGISAGTAVITAVTSNGISVSCTVTVP